MGYRELVPQGEPDNCIVSVKAVVALEIGDVVIWDLTAKDGVSVNTTTTADSPYVAGVMVEAVAAGEYGRMLIHGFADTVKIDGGTTDVAANAILATSTVAGYAYTATGTAGTILGHAPTAVATKTTGAAFIKLA
jgi:hypothetical protein